MKNLLICVKFFFASVIITGLLYPLSITLIGQTFFKDQSNGSLAVKNGQVLGSSLIGQKFDQAKYFWGRPSASDYNPIPSGASNLSATSADLEKIAVERAAKLVSAESVVGAKIPQDLIYASGSGLDPDISPDAALFQVERVSKARNLSRNTVTDLINKSTRKMDFGIFGEPRVNVLQLNQLLDSISK